MKNLKNAAIGLFLCTAGDQISTLFAQGTAFTYQGRLAVGTNVTTGLYDLRFALFDAATAGAQKGSLLTNSATAVTNGLFTVTLDFGSQFPGAARWLELAVRSNGVPAFTTLTPRQSLTPAPYAVFANTASNVSGTISAAQLPAGVVTNNATGLSLAGTFAGNGASVTNVNAASLDGLNSSNFWKLGGNTVAAGQFLGSTNNQPLEFNVNNLRVLRFEDNGDSGADSDTLPDGAPNVIGGSPGNFASPSVVGVTIAGGGATLFSGVAATNVVLSDYSTIGGGVDNYISVASLVSTIGGGSGNTIDTQSQQATIGGGINNRIESKSFGAVIAGGVLGRIATNADYSVIGGGYDNAIGTNNMHTAILGGNLNRIKANSHNAAVGGGGANTIQSNSIYSTISGGCSNLVRGTFATIGGGQTNQALADQATISGGNNNTASGLSSTVGGGDSNRALTESATVAGGYGNIAYGAQATVGGGYINIVSNHYATVSGGQQNFANNQFVAIGGGQNNIAGGLASAISGGGGNLISSGSDYSLIGGGFNNALSSNSTYATITGGQAHNIGANSDWSAIGGGRNHAITDNAQYATIPGGRANSATNLAFAAGFNAQAVHSGAFVWSDSAGTTTSSSTTNSVTFRAHGGYRLFTANGNVGASLDGGQTAWAVISDQNVKKDFAPVNGMEILEKLAALPVTQWHYNWETTETTLHIGPMAQAFKAAFYPGTDDKSITTLEADGVAFAAIQGLNQKLQQKELEISDLKSRLELLEKIVRGQQPVGRSISTEE